MTCVLCRKRIVSEDWAMNDGMAFHKFCQKLLEGYFRTKAQHDAWCHLPDCAQGPKDPFAVSVIQVGEAG